MPKARWYWLSFARALLPGEPPPEGSRFVGVAIVGPAATPEDAMAVAFAHACNPGGECEATPIPAATHVRLADTFRLLDRDEAKSALPASDVAALLDLFDCPRHGKGCPTHAKNEVEHLRAFRDAVLELLTEHPEAREWLPGWARPRAVVS